MPLRLALVALALTLIIAAPAAADNRYCRSLINPSTILALCQDNSSIHLGSQSVVGRNPTIERSFNLTAGEVATIYPSDKKAFLFVAAAGNSAVFSINKRTVVKVGPGGRITVADERDDRRRSFRYRSGTTSPEAAVTQLRDALLSINERESRRVVCAMLSKKSLVFFRFFYGQPEIFDCPYTMRVFFLGSDSSSAVRSIDSRLLGIERIGSSRFLAKLSLSPQSKRRRLKEQSVSLLFIRQDGWRLANPLSLMPLIERRSRSRASAEREARRLTAEGRYWRSLYFARGLALSQPFERSSPLR